MCHRTQTRIKIKACTALLPTAGAECSNTKREVSMWKVTVWIVLMTLFPIVLGGCSRRGSGEAAMRTDPPGALSI
jgi:predicted Na+-dependent transporter